MASPALPAETYEELIDQYRQLVCWQNMSSLHDISAVFKGLWQNVFKLKSQKYSDPCKFLEHQFPPGKKTAQLALQLRSLDFHAMAITKDYYRPAQPHLLTSSNIRLWHLEFQSDLAAHSAPSSRDVLDVLTTAIAGNPGLDTVQLPLESPSLEMTITVGYYLLAVATIHLELISSDVGKLNKNLEMAFARRLLTALHLRTKSCPRAAVEDQELDSLAQATKRPPHRGYLKQFPVPVSQQENPIWYNILTWSQEKENVWLQARQHEHPSNLQWRRCCLWVHLARAGSWSPAELQINTAAFYEGLFNLQLTDWCTILDPAFCPHNSCDVMFKAELNLWRIKLLKEQTSFTNFRAARDHAVRQAPTFKLVISMP